MPPLSDKAQLGRALCPQGGPTFLTFMTGQLINLVLVFNPAGRGLHAIILSTQAQSRFPALNLQTAPARVSYLLAEELGTWSSVGRKRRG